MEEKLKLHEMLYPLGLLDTINKMIEDIAGKSDAVEGKGLSTNDFTDEHLAAVNGALRFDTDQKLSYSEIRTALDNLGGGVLSDNSFTSEDVKALKGAVRFDIPQSLSEQEKRAALNNLGGGKLSQNNFTDEHLAAVNGAVRFDVKQELSDAQKKTAVGNIGAISSDLIGKLSVWISVTEDSPAELFGGSWERISGRFILGADGSHPGLSTGGSADAVVVSHTHSVESLYASYGGVDSNSDILQKGRLGASAGSATGSTRYSSISKTGESGTDKNMPPYVALYIWKRVA